MVWLPQAGVRIIVACALPNWQDVGAALHGVVAFLKSRDFAINFVANLAGAMIGEGAQLTFDGAACHRL